MIRLIHVIGSFQYGGIEKLVFELIRMQCNDPDLSPSVLVEFDKGNLKEDFQKLGIDIYTANLKSGKDLTPGKILNIRNYLNTCDIIHLHDFNFAVALSVFLTNKKVVYTEHGLFGAGRERKYFENISIRARELFIKNRVTRFVCNSEFTRSYASQFYKCSMDKCTVVYNGIKSFHVTDTMETGWLLPKLKNRFVIGSAGRLAGVKRFDRLITAFAKLDISDAVLLIVGSGPLETRLITLTLELQVSERVIFTGYREMISSYLDLMDICVFPSQTEAFGLVAVESLSLGKPTIAFRDGGGLVEIIEPAEKKDIVDSENELLERIKYYYTNRQCIKEKSYLRKERAEFFSLERMHSGYKGIYSKTFLS
jgi:L-malate glycosyltransferase